jgi:hypothetical protein
MDPLPRPFLRDSYATAIRGHAGQLAGDSHVASSPCSYASKTLN